jgi:16S rRNA processing protein RimM
VKDESVQYFDANPKSVQTALHTLHFGRILRPHGVNGAIKIGLDIRPIPQALHPTSLLIAGERHMRKVVRFQLQGEFATVWLENCTNRDDAEKLRQKIVKIDAQQLPQLPTKEYYFHELLGCQVCLEDGSLLGSLEEILETKAHAVYVIQHPTKAEQLLLPAVAELVLAVDKAKNCITVRLVDGMEFTAG